MSDAAGAGRGAGQKVDRDGTGECRIVELVGPALAVGQPVAGRAGSDKQRVVAVAEGDGSVANAVAGDGASVGDGVGMGADQADAIGTGAGDRAIVDDGGLERSWAGRAVVDQHAEAEALDDAAEV